MNWSVRYRSLLCVGHLEEVIGSHARVAEAAVVGVADELKGEVPVAFVVQRSCEEVKKEGMEKEVVQLVREQVGPVASLKMVLVVDKLPKTRSGKILRRTLKELYQGDRYQVLF